MSALVTIGGSLREAFFMFWETLWALVLGFALSGAVQAFVSRGQMQRVMGRHGPAALTRSSLLGMDRFTGRARAQAARPEATRLEATSTCADP